MASRFQARPLTEDETTKLTGDVIELAPPTWSFAARIHTEVVRTGINEHVKSESGLELVDMGVRLDDTIAFIESIDMIESYKRYLAGVKKGRSL